MAGLSVQRVGLLEDTEEVEESDSRYQEVEESDSHYNEVEESDSHYHEVEESDSHYQEGAPFYVDMY